MGKPKDMLGKSFGRLTVIERSGWLGEAAAWRCQCVCGGEVRVSTGGLGSGHTQSCGCLLKERSKEATTLKLEGLRFGRLVVVSRAGSSEKGSAKWACICDCGNQKIATSAALNHGRLISCGCAAIDKPGLRPAAVRAQWSVYDATRRARIKEVGGQYTVEQINELFGKQRGQCACCGSSLQHGYHRDHKIPLTQPGSSNDIGNIELLCGPCNLRKNDKDPIAWANENGRLI